MPKVSVIVPMHNSVDFLAETLASIEMQTLKDIEVICVNDASTDATMDVYNLFAKDDARFTCIDFEKNQGVAAARNTALQHAAGDYVAFMDDDDWYPRDTTLETLYQVASEHDAPIAGGSFSEYDTCRVSRSRKRAASSIAIGRGISDSSDSSSSAASSSITGSSSPRSSATRTRCFSSAR